MNQPEMVLEASIAFMKVVSTTGGVQLANGIAHVQWFTCAASDFELLSTTIRKYCIRIGTINLNFKIF